MGERPIAASEPCPSWWSTLDPGVRWGYKARPTHERGRYGVPVEMDGRTVSYRRGRLTRPMYIHVATYDDSSDLRALEFALDIASATGGDIKVVHVLRPPDDADAGGRDVPPRGPDSGAPEPDSPPPDPSGGTEGGSELQMVSDRDRTVVAASDRILAEARRRTTGTGIAVETELLFGDPEAAIVSYATADGAGLIVLERPSGSERDDAREIADAILRRAPMPVVVVPG